MSFFLLFLEPGANGPTDSPNLSLATLYLELKAETVNLQL